MNAAVPPSSSSPSRAPASPPSASEGRFRALSDSAPVGIFESDRMGNCTYVNLALLEIVRRDEADVLRFGWARTIHPEDRPFVRNNWRSAAVTGRKWNGVVRLVLPDGTLRWIRALAAPIKDAAGVVSGFVGMIEDITDRRTAELALAESEERYRKLLLLSPDAHLVHVNGRFIFANPTLCTLVGARGPEELIGRSVLDIAPPEHHDRVRARIAQLLAGRPPPPAEMEFLRLDGTRVPVEVSAVAFELQGRVEIQVIARDISGRRAAEAALRVNEQRFQLVARAVSDVIWDWDLKTGKVWWSEGLQTLFGHDPANVGRDAATWAALIHPEDREQVVQGIEGAMSGTDAAWEAEYRFRRQDGGYATVNDRAQIMRDAEGHAFRIVGGMSDHTQRKNLEAQFLRSQRMESIGTLAGGIAHDLNNVLAPIIMSIDLLKHDLAGRAEPLMLLETLHGSARRGAELVRQVLTFARGLEGQRVSVNLRHVLDDLEGIIRETFPRNIAISMNAPRTLWPIVGDATQIHQVFLNLAVNARDAMIAGGALAFEAKNVPATTLPASSPGSPVRGNHVLVQVIDTGSGIPPEIRERIFEPFFTTKQVGQGTGLGLSTVHAVVKSHGGAIDVTSEPGQGTTFFVRLPADPACRHDSRPPMPLSLPPGHGELILVVDDEESIRVVTQQTLETFGYRVLSAANGAEALGICSRHSAELRVVLTDMMMPIMDGPTMIPIMLDRHPHVQIIAASGLNAKDDIEKAASAGIAHFLAKPYATQTMLKLLRKVIEARKT